MEETTLQKLLIAPGPRYLSPESLELPEETRKGFFAVKCGEDAYLLTGKEGWRFVAKGRELSEKSEVPASDALSGWRAELSLSPLLTVPALFGRGFLCFEDRKIPLRTSEILPGFFLSFSEEEKLVLVLDRERFLFYGAVGDERFSGYVRNMPQEG